MKVLHVNKFLYRRGGAEGYLLDVSAAQRAAGHETAVFGMQHPDNPPLPHDDVFPPQVELDPPPSGLRGRAATAATMLWSRAAERGMATVLERERPDVVHLHNVYHQLSPSVLRPVRRAGVPMVMTLHDYKLACPTYELVAHGDVCEACLDGRFRHAVAKRCQGTLAGSALLALETRVHRTTRAYDPVDLFLCPSAFLAGRMQAAGVFPERLRVLGNPVDARSTEPAPGPGRDLVVAGRLAPTKGVDVAVRAMEHVPGVVLHVAGEGPERTALEQLAARHAPGRVVFHGRLAREELQALLRGRVAALVPSTWQENMPLAVLEASAAGLPVVVSDLGGLPDLVRDGVDGRVVPPGDPLALAGALRELCDDPERAHRMGRAGRERVLTESGVEGHVARLLELYAEAAERGRPGASRATG